MVREAINKTSLIRGLIDRKAYCQIQFFNAYHEFHTVQGIIKTLVEHSSGDFIEMAAGEHIPLSGLVSIDGTFMPGYEHFEDFTCDC